MSISTSRYRGTKTRLLQNKKIRKNIRFPFEGRVIAVTNPKSPTFTDPSIEKNILAGCSMK